MSDQKKYYFHFTLGPVQSFVAQARRTRDFWAGSFLLSWLSAVAIKSVQVQGGTILFPKPNENYLEFLIGEGEQGKEPKQGSIPNRFKAEINAIDGFDPDAVTQAVLKAWRVLADTIWQADIQPLKLKKGQKDQTKAIWKRQINGFWDMSWIITDSFSDSSVLDQRKNWRTYLAPNEA
ncbi:MAG: type III-B CRISPR-associated protein Cas10/Cmr2, partial [Gammaproteobacteria bacterium]|nr:type III-B CRISPR-associated protein Cas10/Cmr2 [Gammaproteobacteria bacterium]